MNFNRARVVVTDYEYLSPELLVEKLGEAGIHPIIGDCRADDDVIDLAGDADAIIVGSAPITRRVICALSRCKVIVSFRSGVDNIDLEAATQQGIPVYRTMGANCDEVATHAMALLLALIRKVILLNSLVKSQIWEYEPVSPIWRMSGKTLGIVGFGMIGQSLARKARGFDLELLATDPFQTSEVAAEHGVCLIGLEELLRRADYITLHIPLSRETRHLIGLREFQLMKPTALLINTARGAVVDELALHKVLKEGGISGAALDTLEVEPPDPMNPLLELDNVIITPHCAWYSQESTAETVIRAASQVIAVLKGETPPDVTN
jgi:D-3-phosphoglycerate dehydrogenase